MAVQTEGQYTAEFLESESEGTQSRDQVTVTVAAATTLAPGTVLGIITATGAYAIHDPDATDGTEAAAGILYAELINAELTAADFDGVVINWGAEVAKADLQWIAGASVGDKTAAYADLRAKGIKARD